MSSQRLFFLDVIVQKLLEDILKTKLAFHFYQKRCTYEDSFRVLIRLVQNSIHSGRHFRIACDHGIEANLVLFSLKKVLVGWETTRSTFETVFLSKLEFIMSLNSRVSPSMSECGDLAWWRLGWLTEAFSRSTGGGWIEWSVGVAGSLKWAWKRSRLKSKNV